MEPYIISTAFLILDEKIHYLFKFLLFFCIFPLQHLEGTSLFSFQLQLILLLFYLLIFIVRLHLCLALHSHESIFVHGVKPLQGLWSKSQTCMDFLQLQLIVQPFREEDPATMAHALVIARINYCNTLFWTDSLEQTDLQDMLKEQCCLHWYSLFSNEHHESPHKEPTQWETGRPALARPSESGAPEGPLGPYELQRMLDIFLRITLRGGCRPFQGRALGEVLLPIRKAPNWERWRSQLREGRQ